MHVARVSMCSACPCTVHPTAGWYRLDFVTAAPSARAELRIKNPTSGAAYEQLPDPLVPPVYLVPGSGSGSSSQTSTEMSNNTAALPAPGVTTLRPGPGASLASSADAAAFPFPGLTLTPGYTIAYTGVPVGATGVSSSEASGISGSRGSGSLLSEGFSSTTLVPDLSFGPGALMPALFQSAAVRAVYGGAVGEARGLMRVPTAASQGMVFAVS